MLINPRARLLVIYSEKAACTNLHLWFYHHLGCLTAARDYHVWPHFYRDRVYLKSSLYREAFALDLSSFTVLRVVRDPYDRAVSSFRHIVGAGLRDDSLTKHLRNRRIATTGLSFAEFLDCLEATDITACNPHYRLQRQKVEGLLPVHHLINVSKDDLFQRLNAIELALGLPASNIPADPWFRELRFHQRPGRILPDDGTLYRQRLTTDQALNGPWPAYSALLTPEARERIGRLYAVDIATYLAPTATQQTPGA